MKREFPVIDVYNPLLRKMQLAEFLERSPCFEDLALAETTPAQRQFAAALNKIYVRLAAQNAHNAAPADLNGTLAQSDARLLGRFDELRELLGVALGRVARLERDNQALAAQVKDAMQAASAQKVRRE